MKLLAAAMMTMMGTSYAQAPEMAVCKEGMCVMPETAYRQLQVMVGRMVVADRERQRDLDQQTHRADTCEAALRDART